jgi:hypothetical protein
MLMMTKKFSYLCFACIVIGSTSTWRSHAQPILEDVVGMWLFDEGKGKDVRDASGNRLHGEFGRKPEFVEGIFGTALQFSGGEEGPWLEMDGPIKIESVDFSFGCWMIPGRPQICWSTVLSAKDQHKADVGFALEQSNCLNNWYRLVIGNVFNWNIIGNPRNTVRPKPEEWNHVAFVRRGRDGIWYLNGEPDRPKRGNYYVDLGSVEPVKPSRENFRIGNTVFDERRGWKGTLDEVFIFSRALSQLEVQTVMEKGLIGAQAVDSEDKIATIWGRIKS